MDNRLHYMDNLRAIIMLAGVFFHAGLAYSPMYQAVWFSADQVNSRYVEYLVNFFHIFRMPLFFVIAGFFAALLVQRKGLGGMLKNRSGRILLPFILFLPLIMLGFMLPIDWALQHVQNPSPLLQLISGMQQLPDAAKPPPSTGHLWFLYYLMLFYLLVWVGRQLVPVTVKQQLQAWHPLQLIVVLPLLLAPALMLAGSPYPPPESFIPQLWAFGFFGLFFAFGYLLYSAEHILSYFNNSGYWLVLGSLLLFIVFQHNLPQQLGFEPHNPPWPVRSLLIICTLYIAAFMSVAALVFARHRLNGRNRIMRLLADASYWIYIVHLPILLAIQYWLLDQAGGVAYKYAVSVSATLLLCLLSYLLLVRWTPIGWLLNGRRK